MSLLDAIFNKGGGFKGVRCNTLLKLTIPRIKLLRNRRENQLKQMRKDIAKLLETGQEATARIRVEHIIREENMMAAQEILELFCELITVRIPIIEAQRECPLDLKEAISSICFAAPRCADLPELQQVQMMFAGKYGREFVAAATELMPDCSVNRQIIELLSIRAPPVDVKVKLLKEIAEEHGVDWDPSETESEFLKLHEDLLNGPSKFLGGTTVLLLKEKDDETLEHEADFEAGDLDLPEVPKVTIRPSPATTPDIVNMGDASTKEDVSNFPPSPPSGLSFRKDTDNRPSNFSIQPDPNMESDMNAPEPKLPSTYEPSNVFSDTTESRKFIPFVSPPPLSSTPPFKSHEPLSSTPDFKSHEPQSPNPLFKSHEAPPSSESHRNLSQATNEDNIDLEDVLAAAQTAAETAERAAAAARAAASLAQVRISELVMKRNGQAYERNESRSELDQSKPRDQDKDVIDQHHSFENADPSPSLESSKLQSESFAHQPSRSTSMDDDPYFSYPNLFGRQDSNLGSAAQTPVDNSRFSHDF